MMRGRHITGSGVRAKEVRAVPNFRGLELAGIGTVRLATGTVPSLEVEADDNVLARLLTEVTGGVLSLRLERGVQLAPKTPVVYTVVAPSVELITLSGTGDIYAENLRGQGLELALSGAGDMKLSSLTLATLTARLSGTGQLELRGSATTQNLSLSGAGSCLTCALEGSEVNVDLSGNGDAHVWATASLRTSISGVGTVRYRGSPSLTSEVSGIGAVTASDTCP